MGRIEEIDKKLRKRTERLQQKYERLPQEPGIEQEYQIFQSALSVNTFTWAQNTWTNLYGSEPFLDAADAPSNYILDSTQTDTIKSQGEFGFVNLPSEADEIESVTLYVKGRRAYSWGWGILICVINGTAEGSMTWTSQSWSYKTLDLTLVLNTVAKVNSALLRCDHDLSSNGGLAVDHAYLEVVYRAY